MRKSFFLVLFVYMSCQGYSIDRFLQQAVDNYRTIVQLMDHYRDQIEIVHWVSGWGNNRKHHYKPYCNSTEARHALNAFEGNQEELTFCLQRASLGDGFILGVLVGCCSRLFKRDLFDKKTIFAGVLAAIAWIAYQNSQIGVVPSYSNYTLERIENIFANISEGSFLRLVGLMASASISYLTSRLVLDRLTASDKEQKTISSIVALDSND